MSSKRKKGEWEFIKIHGRDILESPNFKASDKHFQHGTISVKTHSEQVALSALKIARKLPIKFCEKDLVRGALLHDYFQYDWHHKKVDISSILRFYEMHGFTHPKTALKNAEKEFHLSHREKDIIQKHMWPLTVVPPMCREAWVVTCADKYCSLLETMHIQNYGKKSVQNLKQNSNKKYSNGKKDSTLKNSQVRQKRNKNGRNYITLQTRSVSEK